MNIITVYILGAHIIFLAIYTNEFTKEWTS